MKVTAKAATRTRPAGFGFQPEESEHHFLVTVAPGKHRDVLVSEHLRFDPETGYASPSLGLGTHDAKLRSRLARAKWDAIADEIRVEFNRRLKQEGLPSGRWKTGNNPVSRLLGKELTLLAWAIEDADPTLVPAAVKNWLGLAPEERWWLFTMTNAATGHAIHGRGKGWRKAVRFALTENPVSGARHEAPMELFRLVAAEEREEASSPRHRNTDSRREVASAGGSKTEGTGRGKIGSTGRGGTAGAGTLGL